MVSAWALPLLSLRAEAVSGGFCRVAAWHCFFASSSQPFHYIEAHWNQEGGDDCVGQHAPDDNGAQDPSSRCARARGDPQRHTAQDECERGHEEWAPTQTRSF